MEESLEEVDGDTATVVCDCATVFIEDIVVGDDAGNGEEDADDVPAFSSTLLKCGCDDDTCTENNSNDRQIRDV